MVRIDPSRVQPVTIVASPLGDLVALDFPLPTIDQASRLILRCDIDAVTGLVLYIGRATPGTLASDSAWQIRNFTYDGSNHLTFSGYPGGDTSFGFVWTARAGYTYT